MHFEFGKWFSEEKIFNPPLVIIKKFCSIGVHLSRYTVDNKSSSNSFIRASSFSFSSSFSLAASVSRINTYDGVVTGL